MGTGGVSLEGVLGRGKQSDGINDRGFTTVHNILNPCTIEMLRGELDGAERGARISQRGEIYAIRNVLATAAAVRDLAADERVRRLVVPLLGLGAFPVQGIFFDKPADANWKVPWHQDLSIPVKARIEVPEFGPWSIKAGV